MSGFVGGGPALVGGLAGDADAQRDVGPAVALGAQPIDGDLDGTLEFAFQAEQVGEFVDVAGGDATGRSADDPAGKGRVVVVFHGRAVSSLRCQGRLDAPGRVGRAGGHVSVCTPHSECQRI
jgi:hypothetical protein